MTQRARFQRIDVTEAQDLLSGGDVVVLDVRDSKSYAQSHVDGACNVSITTLWSVLEATAKTTPVLIYCYHGYASQEYAQVFSDFGFLRVFSLDGGYEAWRSNTAEAYTLAPALARWLADQGFPAGRIDATDTNNMTALMRAAHQGETDIVGLLIAAGADLAARNADGNNALWLACVGDHLDTMEALIKAGIDIDNRNDNGATALMYAASAGKAAVIERLLAAGADPSPETLDGFTALDMAATLECLTLLRKANRPQIAALA